MATRENSYSPSRPVWLVKDAVSVNAGTTVSAVIPCEGFAWAYLEVDCDKAYSIYALGNSGFGSSATYYQVNSSGGLAGKTGLTGGNGYSMIIPCRNLAKVGAYVRNDDGALAATVTVRISLAHE